jgi:hypothetical protein
MCPLHDQFRLSVGGLGRQLLAGASRPQSVLVAARPLEPLTPLGPSVFHQVGPEVETSQRSTSPRTGSMLDITAITSGMKPPRAMGARPCKLAKEGARTCSRYGRDVPSETM